MGTNVAQFVWCSFTHSRPAHLLLPTPISSPLKSSFYFVLFRRRCQSIWGRRGYSVLKNPLFDRKKKKKKKGHFLFQRKIQRLCRTSKLRKRPVKRLWLGASKEDKRGILSLMSLHSSMFIFFNHCPRPLLMLRFVAVQNYEFKDSLWSSFNLL